VHAAVMRAASHHKTHPLTGTLEDAFSTYPMAAMSASLDSQDPTLVAAGSLCADAAAPTPPPAPAPLPCTGPSSRSGRQCDASEHEAGATSQCSVGSLQPHSHTEGTATASQSSAQWRTPPASPQPDSEPMASRRAPGSEQKRSRRMMWSDQLHRQFLQALSDIGLRHAVPKTIMQVRGRTCPV
jgi:hypothetical protein